MWVTLFLIGVLLILLFYVYRNHKIRRTLCGLTEILNDVQSDDILRSTKQLGHWLGSLFSTPKIDGHFLGQKVQVEAWSAPSDFGGVSELKISLAFRSRCPIFEVRRKRGLPWGRSAVGDKVQLEIRNLENKFRCYCEQSRLTEFIDCIQDPLVFTSLEALLYHSDIDMIGCIPMAPSGEPGVPPPRISTSTLTYRTFEVNSRYSFKLDNLSVHNMRKVLENIHVLATTLEAQFPL